MLKKSGSICIIGSIDCIREPAAKHHNIISSHLVASWDVNLLLANDGIDINLHKSCYFGIGDGPQDM